MQILKKLTVKDLKLNRKRTIGTLIGIILSTALITVVGLMFFTMQNTLIQTSINNEGYYHIQLSDISILQAETVKKNKDFSNIETVNDLGHSLTAFKEDFLHTHLYSMSEETANYLKYNVIEGRFPKNNKEVIVSRYFANKLELKIGDIVKFTSGDLVNEDGKAITEVYYGSESQLVNTKDYEFTIVGFTNKYSTVITTDTPSDKIDVYLTLNNVKNFKKDLNELLGTKNFEEETSKIYSDYYINRELLRWEAFSFSDTTLAMLFGIVSVIIVIILITSIFSIRNSFSISTIEKTKIYGMLSSVGATKKQIKNMVLFEGGYLGMIGLPIGAGFGSFVSYILVKIVNKIAIKGGVFEETFCLYYKFSIIPIIIAIIIGIIMIYFSSIKCARKASKVSPIQNIRNADNLSSKKIKLKVPFFIRKIFKIGGILSYKNLKRSKKKYRVTVVSLTVSIFVFITVSSIVQYAIKAVKENYIDIGYNVTVSDYRNNQETFQDEEKFNELKNMDTSYVKYTVKRDYIEKNGYYTILDTSKVIYKNVITDYSNENSTEKREGIITREAIFDDEYFKVLAKQIHKNYDDIKDKIIIVNKAKDSSVNNKNLFTKIVNYKEGDIVTLTSIVTNKEISFEIGAIIDQMPIGLEGQYYDNLTLIINKDYLDLEVEPEVIYYKSKNPDVLSLDIEERFPKVEVYNINEQVNALKSILIIVSIFIYGFIIVVTLIGVTAIFNTITSNMELRKREFAMLKSIGMTKKEFNNMIYFESLFYSFKSLFFGTVIGLVGSNIVYRIFAKNWDFGFIFPTVPIVISCVFVVIIVLIIMKYSMKKIEKQNIIETIRKENI